MDSTYGKYPYITLADAKNFLSINSNTDDHVLSNTINFACGVVEHIIGYEVLSNTYTETFDGGTSSIFVPRLPLNNVHALSEYDGSNYTELSPPTSTGQLINQDLDSHSLTVEGNTHLRTRHKKFGKSSAYFDGSTNSDYISIPNSDDWYFDSDNFTIEGSFRLHSYSTNQTLLSQVQDSNNYWKLMYDTTLGLTFTAISGGTEVVNVNHNATTGYSANSFSTFSVVRNNNDFTLYRDGSQLASSAHSNTMPDLSGALEIGRNSITSNEQYYTGNIDEIIIAHSALHTAAYTNPIYPNTPDNDTKLLIHFDGANNSVSIKDVHATESEFVFNNDTGEICRECRALELTVNKPRTFNNYSNGVKVTYSSGWDISNLPTDLKYATLEMVKHIHKGSSDIASFSFQGETGTSIPLSNNIPAHIKRVLDLYRVY